MKKLSPLFWYKFQNFGNAKSVKSSIEQQPYFAKIMQYLAEPHQIGQQIIKTILNHQDSQTMFSEIAMQLGELFGVDICAILSGEANYADLSHQGLWRKQKYSALESESLDRALLELFIDDREVCLKPRNSSEVSPLELEIVNFKKYPLNSLTNRFGKILSVKSILAIKIGVSEKTHGLILLGKERVYDWDSSEEELLKSLSESVAIAISQVHLQQKTRTQARYQKAIEEVSLAISQNTDIERLLELALTKTAEALQVNCGSILMLKYKQPPLNDRHSKLIGKATAQISCSWSKTPIVKANNRTNSFELSESALTQSAWQKAPQPLAISDRQAWRESNRDRFPSLDRDRVESIFEASNAEALLMMPLMGNVSNDGKPSLVIGFLVLQHNYSHLWRSEELALVNWMSIQLGTALIHSQTLNRVQSVVDERTSRLKWSVDVQAKLSEKMRQQIDELRQLNELKDDFLNSISHELKTPLTSMKMAIKMLRQPGLPEASKEKYLNILEQEWNREYNLIKDLLTLQQVESENFKIHPKELNLDTIISELAKSFQQKWQADKDLSLEVISVRSPLTLYTDSESLQQILEELLLNAGKYSDPDTTVNLQVNRRITAKAHQIEITVSNQGAGISQQELPNIFDKFRRGKGVTDRAVPGTGLGLTLVKYLVEHLNGTIDVSSTPLEDNPSTFETTFKVTLPQLFSPK
jgi:signal transduction histidine kinase